MEKWEYMTISTKPVRKDNGFFEPSEYFIDLDNIVTGSLNDLGNAGWEAISMVPINMAGHTLSVCVLLKRKVT